MVSVEQAFFAVAAIIFIGYFGLAFFKKTKVSEIIILMLIGLVMGPVLGFLGADEIALFQGFLPFFASFALTVILFEGGMQLNFFKTLKSLPSTFVFTIIVFALTLLLIAIGWFVLNGNLMHGLLIGAILAGTSSAIIIPLVNQTNAKDETKMLLGLESALTDALCAIAALTVAGVIALISAGNGGNITPASIGTALLGAFSIAAVLGLIAGFVWLNLLRFFEKKPYEYLLTLATLLFLYAITQYFGGNGAIAALVFGLVLGNSEDLTNMLKFSPRKIEQSIKSFQMEVSFLVRTFFFVYLGLLFKPVYLQNMLVIGIALLIMIVILLARFVGSKIISKFKPEFAGDTLLLVTMNARGLAAAGLISYPAIVSLNLGEVFNQMAAIVFIVILLSNIITTIGVFLTERAIKKTPTTTN